MTNIEKNYPRTLNLALGLGYTVFRVRVNFRPFELVNYVEKDALHMRIFTRKGTLYHMSTSREPFLDICLL